jgi:hypothetical protein
VGSGGRYWRQSAAFVTVWVRVAADKSATLIASRSEMGQGTTTEQLRATLRKTGSGKSIREAFDRAHETPLLISRAAYLTFPCQYAPNLERRDDVALVLRRSSLTWPTSCRLQ